MEKDIVGLLSVLADVRCDEYDMEADRIERWTAQHTPHKRRRRPQMELIRIGVGGIETFL